MKTLKLLILSILLSSAGCYSHGMTEPLELPSIQTQRTNLGVTPDIEPRFDMVCTMEYDPVCVSRAKECFYTPCERFEKTFSNRCAAHAAGFIKYKKGEC